MHLRRKTMYKRMSFIIGMIPSQLASCYLLPKISHNVSLAVPITKGQEWQRLRVFLVNVNGIFASRDWFDPRLPHFRETECSLQWGQSRQNHLITHTIHVLKQISGQCFEVWIFCILAITDQVSIGCLIWASTLLLISSVVGKYWQTRCDPQLAQYWATYGPVLACHTLHTTGPVIPNQHIDSI